MIIFRCSTPNRVRNKIAAKLILYRYGRGQALPLTVLHIWFSPIQNRPEGQGNRQPHTFFFVEEKYPAHHNSQVPRQRTSYLVVLGQVVIPYRHIYYIIIFIIVKYKIRCLTPNYATGELSPVNQFFQNRQNFIRLIRFAIPFITDFFVIIKQNVIACGHPYFFWHSVCCNVNSIECNRAEVSM